MSRLPAGTGGWCPVRYSSARSPYIAAAIAVCAQWLDCTPPVVRTTVARWDSASPSRAASLRILLPPAAIPHRSSRLASSSGPGLNADIRPVSRCSGVGPRPSTIRGNAVGRPSRLTGCSGSGCVFMERLTFSVSRGGLAAPCTVTRSASQRRRPAGAVPPFRGFGICRGAAGVTRRRPTTCRIVTRRLPRPIATRPDHFEAVIAAMMARHQVHSHRCGADRYGDHCAVASVNRHSSSLVRSPVAPAGHDGGGRSGSGACNVSCTRGTITDHGTRPRPEVELR